MNRSPAIQARGLTLSFDGRFLLRDFSLRIESGETVVLTGDSGCGKSSLLACLMGFLAPASGQVEIRGEALSAQTAWHLRRNMALVQQEPDLGEQTVREWIAEPFAFRGNRSRPMQETRLESLLERLRLPAAILAKPGLQLSGGEKQRVALVSALLLNRPILLLDEPVSALDEEARRAVYACLGELTDTTIVMVSHDPASVAGLADRMIRLTPGGETHGRD